jgi:hypothetical protein
MLRAAWDRRPKAAIDVDMSVDAWTSFFGKD